MCAIGRLRMRSFWRRSERTVLRLSSDKKILRILIYLLLLLAVPFWIALVGPLGHPETVLSVGSVSSFGKVMIASISVVLAYGLLLVYVRVVNAIQNPPEANHLLQRITTAALFLALMPLFMLIAMWCGTALR